MALHLSQLIPPHCPSEPILLNALTVRLIDPAERARFDELLEQQHYLHNPTAVGAVLRYVVTHHDTWLALLVFCSPALHLKPRERWLQWSARDVPQRRHLLAQNSRFLVLAAPGRWPNLASRVLKLVCDRLSADWQQAFGHPILAVETFVDPQRFRGTCYRAAGWQQLGLTQGAQRDWQDFYTDTAHPKQLWVRALAPRALAQLRAPVLAPHLHNGQPPPPPPCPVPTPQLPSLFARFRDGLTDPRHAKGKRHPLASILTILALGIAAGCKGPHAIAEFAASLNHGQRRRLRCWRRRDRPRQFDVPGERTIRRALATVDAAQLTAVLVQWQAAQEPRPTVVHLDGKVVKNADPAPARTVTPPVPVTEIPVPQQKPKADKALTLVNVVTARQQLWEQIAVPRDTNEEAAVAAHWPKMDLTGMCLTADAAHTTKFNAQHLTLYNGADYLLFLKGNQPHAFAKAQQLLPGAFPPSSPNVG
jgi:hypothetical protein